MVVATAGGTQDAWACKRTAQLTAQAGNVLEAAVGTMFCDETDSKKRNVHKRTRREVRCFDDAIVESVPDRHGSFALGEYRGSWTLVRSIYIFNARSVVRWQTRSPSFQVANWCRYMLLANERDESFRSLYFTCRQQRPALAGVVRMDRGSERGLRMGIFFSEKDNGRHVLPHCRRHPNEAEGDQRRRRGKDRMAGRGGSRDEELFDDSDRG